ncbi:unnamed protein product, partial [Lymnaea stagnalis]
MWQVRDKTTFSLERLMMVEMKSSSLMLKNQQQQKQYEKCHDGIANQVVPVL